MKNVLLSHARRYPAMEVQDAIKLCYQAVYGGGHLIRPEAAERLRTERAALVPDPSLPLCEEIGGRMVRLQLASPACRSLSDALIFRMFSASAARMTAKEGKTDRMEAALSALEALTQAGSMPFSAGEAEKALSAYRSAGYPMLSHSAAYRAAYHPAYRVMESVYPSLIPAIRRTDSLLSGASGGHPVIAAIDGPAGSGKTTAAEALTSLYGCPVLHLDDFFLPFSMRTEDRLKTPGGNVHYERFREEVLIPLSAGKEAVFRPFDCRTGTFAEEVTVKPAPLLLVEGSYSHHPALRPFYDLCICLSVSEEEQQRRIRQRNGEAGLAMFLERWIPLEQLYFEACEIPRHADLLLTIS